MSSDCTFLEIPETNEKLGYRFDIGKTRETEEEKLKGGKGREIYKEGKGGGGWDIQRGRREGDKGREGGRCREGGRGGGREGKKEKR